MKTPLILCYLLIELYLNITEKFDFKYFPNLPLYIHTQLKLSCLNIST